MIISELSLATMRRRWRGRSVWPSVAAVVSDAVMVPATLALAWAARVQLPWFDAAKDVSANARMALLPMALGWILVLVLNGSLAPNAMGAGTVEFRRVITGTAVTFGAIGVGCFLIPFHLSRGLFIMAALLGVPALVTGRYAVRRVIRGFRENGGLAQTVLLVGSPHQVDEVAAVLRRERWLGYDILGAILPTSETLAETPDGVPVLGSTARTDVIVREWDPDAVLFAGGAVNSAREMRRMAWSLESSGARIMLVPSLTDCAGDRIRLRAAAGLHMMELEGPASHVTSQVLKRVFDVVGALVIMVLSAPVFLATALAIKLHDGGPVLYRQVRTGRGGVTFGCFKFRSMVVNAEEIRNTVASHHADGHVLFKARNDPRITAPGRFIRRFSIDELPQLINVLQGSMSLVGPRPPLPSEVANYSEDVHRRLAVPPGMTGLWQVSGRSDLSWDDTVRLDLYYVDNWSILRDLTILARTAKAVVSRRGAY